MTSITSQYSELCDINLEGFIDKSKYIKIKMVGTIKTIFKHKKYIVEVYIQRKLVIRAYKRYNQFEALHQLITMKYKNYDLEQMPSKFQIFNKEETRKEFFQKFLSKIIKDHQHVNPTGERLQGTKRRMLSIIYLFLVSHQNESKSEEFNKAVNSKLKKVRKPSQYSSDQSLGDKSEVDRAVTSFGQNFLKKMEQQEIKSAHDEPYKIYKLQQKFPKQVKNIQRKHRLSFEGDYHFQIQNRPRCNSLENQFLSQQTHSIIQQNEFQVKFQHEGGWKRRFIYIKNSEIQLYKQKLDNHFRTKIQLFRIKVEYLRRTPNLIDHFCEKMQFNLTRTFKQDPRILSIYHQHDHQKINIRRPQRVRDDPIYNKKILDNLKQKLISAANISPINPNYDGVFNPIGKMFIYLHKIKLLWKKYSDNETLQIRIRTEALAYDARPIVYGQQISINQGFLIPISSSFQIIKFECYKIKDEGFIKDKQSIDGKLMGTFSFTMTELLTKPLGFFLPKVWITLQTEQSRAQKYQTSLQISLENFSDFSSIYGESYSSEHDGKALRPIKGLQDLEQLSLTVDRVLRILGNIALFIQAFWRNVYLFKYPRLGYFFFSVLLFNSLFLDIGDIIKQIFIVLMVGICYHQSYVNMIVNQLMDKYVFSYQHPSFKNPLILSTGQVKYLKWSNQLDFIAEEYVLTDGRLEKKNIDKRTVFQFVVHDRKFYVREEEQSFFEKFKQAKKIIELIHKMIDSVANTVQKVGNLLTWADPKRTLFILFIVVLFSGVASGQLVRGIISLFCIHRFVKGKVFYTKKHYRNNRSFAVYCFDYILHKSFPQLIGDTSNMKFEELDDYLSELIFPIHDDASAKKMKVEMDEIMGVYFDPEALYSWTPKKNELKVGIFINFVQSCQSRLKLKWIPGPQGISNQFQKLKEQTKQIPVIDVWLESLVTNFIMNTPSQLYTKFWNDQNSLTNVRRIRKIKKQSNKEVINKSISSPSMKESKHSILSKKQQ